MKSEPLLVSILIPVLNEEENIERAYQAVTQIFKGLTSAYRYELLFTDNASTDRTFSILQGLAARDPGVRVIRFARNHGYQRSVFVGLLNAAGDCAIQLDCDLQDPPELIPHMLEHWRAGAAVVYGVRRSRPEKWWVQGARRLFYRVIRALSDDDLPLDAGDFRLIDRRILEQIRLVDDATPYLRGLIASMGFIQVGLPYDRAARTAGESKFNFRSTVKLAIDGVLNHSLVPLRLASLTSLTVGVVMLVTIAGYVMGKLLFGQDWPAGFATTTVLILMSITLNALFLGIIGEYMGRIYIQSKRRPLVIIERSLNKPTVELGATGTSRPHVLL